jgi:chromosomal replication initiation ATPase DnaA
MDNFINYLDNYKSVHSIDYNDVCNITNTIQYHFDVNELYEEQITGLSYYDNYSTSLWNSLNNVNINTTNKYDLWKKKHELITNEHNKKNDIIKKQNVYINVSVNEINDLIKIIDDNPYNDENEYNIDLKSLHNIRDELCELNRMIGIDKLKTSILNQLIYFIQELHIGNGSSDFKHTVISGPPGTGKTEIAKIIGKMYSKVGILKKNVFKKVTRNDLVAGYLGQTAIKTKAVINECIGGCLFIDEAYSLANDNDSYSKECIDTICEALSYHKDELMVIIAGYENELNDKFFKSNPGLESRFIWRFNIDNYNANEMMQIFKKNVSDNQWNLENDDIIKCKWFEDKKDEFKSFGRDMELLFSYIKISHSRRIYGKDVKIRKIITLEDMDNGYKLFLDNKKNKNKNTVLYGLYV